MRRIVAAAFVSLDGIMQAPGGPEEDPTGGFKFGGWIVPMSSMETGEAVGALFEKPFDLLLGRKTYDIFAAHWPYTTDHGPIATAFNNATKYVASRSSRKLDWQNSQSLGSDVITSLKALKETDGPDLLTQGSGDFLQTLLAHGLIDEINLLIFPVLLGTGKRLFRDGIAPSALKLVKSKCTDGGVMIATYEPDGPVRTGSFQMPDPSPAEIERRRNLK